MSFGNTGLGAIARNVVGHEPADATRTARLEMGSVEAVKDEVRDVGWETTVEGIWRDARHGLRLLRRSPGFTVVTVLTLALGIGANTAVFSVAHAVLFQSLPYPEPERLVALVPAPKNQPSTAEPISYPTFLDWQEQSRSFESLGAYVVAQSTLTARDADAPIAVAVLRALFDAKQTARRPRALPGRLRSRCAGAPS